MNQTDGMVRRLRLGFVILAAGVGVAACGSNPPAASGAGTPGSHGPSGTSAIGNLQQLSAKWRNTPAKVTYQMSGTGAGDGAVTISWMPPGSARIDYSGNSGSGIFIITGSTFYICGNNQCLKTTGSSNASALSSVPFADLFSSDSALAQQIAALGGDQVSSSHQTIAGTDSQCFTYNGSGGSGEYCFSSDGVLTLVKGGNAGSQVTLQATRFSTQVSASDFSPPYPVTDLSGLLPSASS